MSQDDLWKMSMYDLYLTKLYDSVKESIKELNKDNVIDVCWNLMKAVEAYKIEGVQKKELVLSVLTKICEDLKVDKGILLVLPGAIDYLVGVWNREKTLVDNKVKKVSGCGCF